MFCTHIDARNGFPTARLFAIEALQTLIGAFTHTVGGIQRVDEWTRWGARSGIAAGLGWGAQERPFVASTLPWLIAHLCVSE